MVDTFNEPKFQNAILPTMWLLVQIPSGQENKWIDLTTKVAKK
jgi:hypothetical protein